MQPRPSGSKSRPTARKRAGDAADEQSSLTLDPSVIGSNLAQDGQAVAEAGQVASLTSVNNFINFCVGKTITNGLQDQSGSCNPVPMGDIPGKGAQPACKFSFPTNLANIDENTAFTVKMNIQGMETGAFVNPNTNYFAAPQQLNGQGQIVGHSHVVIQAINGITDTAPADPTVFAFFQGLNAPAAGGVLSSDVAKGLPAGTYRLFSINTAANHQPVIGPVAQHGSFDDAVYFTVGAAAAAAAQKAVGADAAAAGAGAAAASSAAAAASGTAAAASDTAAAASDTAAAASGTAAAAASGTAAAVATPSAVSVKSGTKTGGKTGGRVSGHI
ncbi:hypothetical protein BU17DRAFT_74527 [Hysterangium stoloniferum]|nr:hypothetical protein BU17DRAFT_74527 [Hysterangium stoloniferum]